LEEKERKKKKNLENFNGT